MRLVYSTILKNGFTETNCICEQNTYGFKNAFILSQSIILNILLLVIVGVISILVLNQI